MLCIIIIIIITHDELEGKGVVGEKDALVVKSLSSESNYGDTPSIVITF